MKTQQTSLAAAAKAVPRRATVDPITLEVVGNSLIAYAEEMALALCKSAYNMMIYEVRDFCCGLIDTEGRMICQNEGGLPIFLADLGIAVKDGIDRFGLDGFTPGDVIIMNHAGVCGQHLNNVVVYTPCFFEGKVVAFAANRAHWADVGGLRTGFGNVQTYEIFHEGIQMRSIKIYDAGKRNEGVWQMISDNIRFPEASLGDLRAQIAACQLGGRRLAELYGRHTVQTVSDCIEASWDQAEAEARAVVESIPDGVYTAESRLDSDGRRLDVPLRVKVTVKVEGSNLTIDYSDMNEQVPGPLNSGYSGGLSAARVAFKCITMPHAPVNEGCFRALTLISPEGTMLNARPPAALGLWSIALPTVIDTLLRALSQALPDFVPAAHKGDMGGCSFYGQREENGERYVLMNIFGGGWGGRAKEDGASASVSICQGDVRNTPVELQEIRYPFLVECHQLREDSGGAGEHRGGLGVVLRYKALQKSTVNVNLERIIEPPWGAKGGNPGASNAASIRRNDGSERSVTKESNIALAAGDTITFWTAGGGGYGDARERSRERVEDDLQKGYVSAAGAVRDYGVQVDEEETAS
ncbi:hydantoinase B/oxoprolinase family protein [Paraburkholderia sp. ZP32-5]|uniref:hydantoinase B/oxoprolinase family protein n=1 Tax=Paraburkholderia sp. ZP32-5 TaxID=2883245 RepID=UPI001F1678E2|nr:hydantoinase B/oxoprolinase family protein [Paraburkholderia sp. ZP32-5]